MYFQKAYNGFLKIAQDNLDDKILYRLGVITFSGTGCDADREMNMLMRFWKTVTNTFRRQLRIPYSPCFSH